MADDDTQPATPAQADDSDAAGTNDPKPGVSIPSWMAGALVVVLALAIGLAGFAVGRSTADDGGRQFQPIGAQAPGGGGQGDGELPFPGGPGGPGGEGGPGGPGGQRGERGEQREGDEGQQDDEEDGDQSEDEEPEQDQDQGEGL